MYLIVLFIFYSKAIELAKDNIKNLYSCLLTCLDYPKEFQPRTEIHKIIEKLKDINNSSVDDALGKYYLKYEQVWSKLFYKYF